MEEDYDKLEGKKILVVDDNEPNIYAMRATLESYGLEVISAMDGQSAIDILNEDSKIDLVLMDVMMPRMDGYEAMKQIRSTEKIKDLPIIAVTAQAMKTDHQKSIDAGANDYFSKPVDADALLQGIAKLLLPE